MKEQAWGTRHHVVARWFAALVQQHLAHPLAHGHPAPLGQGRQFLVLVLGHPRAHRRRSLLGKGILFARHLVTCSLSLDASEWLMIQERAAARFLRDRFFSTSTPASTRVYQVVGDVSPPTPDAEGSVPCITTLSRAGNRIPTVPILRHCRVSTRARIGGAK
jgi:hypothetical protein